MHEPVSTYVRVGLTQTRPNKSIINIASFTTLYTYTYIPLTLEMYPLGEPCTGVYVCEIYLYV